jgi:hypothetical protein
MTTGNLDQYIEDRENVKPTTYEPVPAGVYEAVIMESELAPTSKGDGIVLKTTHVIFNDPDFEGREIRTYFNIKNPNEKAEQIGRGNLSSLGRAVGFLGIPPNHEDLHNKKHFIKVALQEGKGLNPKTGEPYGPSSVIKKFMSFDATKKPTKTASAPTVASPTLTSDELPDFMK